MGDRLSDWEEYIKEHSDLEWNEDHGELYGDATFVIAQCTLFFDTGN